jgi:hypothetical protein
MGGSFSEQPRPIKFLLVLNGLAIVFAVILLVLAGKGMAGNEEKFTVPSYVIPMAFVSGILFAFIGVIGMLGVCKAKQNPKNKQMLIYAAGAGIAVILLLVGIAGLAQARGLIDNDKIDSAATKVTEEQQKLPVRAIDAASTLSAQAWKDFQKDAKCCGLYPLWAPIIANGTQITDDTYDKNLKLISNSETCTANTTSKSSNDAKAVATIVNKALHCNDGTNNGCPKVKDLRKDLSGADLAKYEKGATELGLKFCRDEVMTKASSQIGLLMAFVGLMIALQIMAFIYSMWVICFFKPDQEQIN